MAHPLYHSRASAHRYGGQATDYLELHCFLDQTKALIADCRHRLILHNPWGIHMAVARFGPTVAGISTENLATDHIVEDMGHVPTLVEAIPSLPATWWVGSRSLEEELGPTTEGNHARRSALRFGGQPVDYRAVHALLDSPARDLRDWRHRVPTHNAWGPFLCEAVLGPVLTGTQGREIPTRVIAEDHILYDLGRIPTVAEALDGIALEAWMCNAAQQLSQHFPHIARHAPASG